MSNRPNWKLSLSALMVVMSLLLSACGGVDAGVDNNNQQISQADQRATIEAEVSATEAARQAGGVTPAATQSVGATETSTGNDVGATATADVGDVTGAPTAGATEQTTEPTVGAEPTAGSTPTEGDGNVVAPAPGDDTNGQPTSPVTYGTAPPEPTETPTPKPTNTPVAAKPRIDRAVLVAGAANPNATKSATAFSLKERQISLVGRIVNAPDYSTLYAKWEAVEIPGVEIISGTIAQQSKSVQGTQPFSFELKLDQPPQEGKYKVTLEIGNETLKTIPFSFVAPPPRVIGQPGPRLRGGTGRLTLKFPERASFWQYKIIDASGNEVASQYGNSLEYEETPGVYQLPAGTYTIEWSPGSYGQRGGLYRVVLAAGRETVVPLGALRIVSGQVPQEVLLVDAVTGRPAGGEYTSGSSKEGLLKTPTVIPPGRYEVYFESSNRTVRVGEVEVKAGLVATLEI